MEKGPDFSHHTGRRAEKTVVRIPPESSDASSGASSHGHRHRHSAEYPTFRFIASEKSRERRIAPDLLKDGQNRTRFRRFLRRIRSVGISSIPFVIFLAGVVLLSVGFFSYVENESILAIFITGRDEVAAVAAGGQNVTATASETVRESATLPSETKGRLVVPFYYQGDQIGTLRIASIELEVGVYQGDSEDQFRLGSGHYSGSFLPGQEGNTVLAAHRTTYFRDLEYVKVGDVVEFETTYGTFSYRIRDISILEKADFDKITAQTDEEVLTLYTCYPFIYVGNAPNRYVVTCDLLSQELFS